MQNSVAPVAAVWRAASTSDGMSSQTARTGEANTPDWRAEVAVLRAAAGLDRDDALDLDVGSAPAHADLVRELQGGRQVLVGQGQHLEDARLVEADAVVEDLGAGAVEDRLTWVVPYKRFWWDRTNGRGPVGQRSLAQAGRGVGVASVHPAQPLARRRADRGRPGRGPVAGRRGRPPLPRRRLLAVGDHVRPPDAGDRRRDPRPSSTGWTTPPSSARPTCRASSWPSGCWRPPRPATGPALGKVFFAGDGSSAVEVALKMAYQASVQQDDGRGRSSCTWPRRTTATRSAR